MDLEWNQCACGKESSVERLPFEIFEIGAVKLDENRKRISEFHGLIRPSVYKELHPVISEVTHVSMEELEACGGTFQSVMEEFLDWCGTDFFFCTWGSMDLTELQRNMSYYGMELPFPKPFLFYDVQKLFSIEYSDGKTRESLDEAVDFLHLKTDVPFHRALDDAGYTAAIMERLDFEKVGPYVSTDYYRVPENREEEFLLEFPDYTKFVSRVFESREDAMKDKSVTDMRCCRCKRMLRKKIRWFACGGQRFYLCLAVCPDHGFVRGKIRIKKREDGTVFAVRTQKIVDESGAELVFKKKEAEQVRRAEKQKMKKKAGHGIPAM